MNGFIKVNVASQNTRRKWRRKVFERIKESEWGKFYMRIKYLRNISQVAKSELARTLFS